MDLTKKKKKSLEADRVGGDICGEKRRFVWRVEARSSAQPCLCGRRPAAVQLRRLLNSDAACLSAAAATGGNALINTDCPSWLPADPSHWRFQELLASLSSPRSPLIHVWVALVFPYWYLDWWRRCRSESYWPGGKWYASNCLGVFEQNGACKRRRFGLKNEVQQVGVSRVVQQLWWLEKKKKRL